MKGANHKKISFHIYEISRIDKYRDRGSRLMVTKSWRMQNWGVIAKKSNP